MSAPAFHRPGAEVFVPDGAPPGEALRRTTHLAIGAHADDLEFFAWPGIDACHGRSDRRFTGVVLCDGGGSPRRGAYSDFTDARMIAARREEQRAASVLGDYSCVVQLDWPGAVVRDARDPRPGEDLAAVLADMRPEVAYLHNPADRHDTHVACFLRSLGALRALPADRRPSRVLGCEVWRGLDWLVEGDRVALDTGGRPGLQRRLNATFRTQIAGGKRYDLAVRGRRLANATFNDPHAVDRERGLVFAMDLAPLVADPAADPVDFAAGFAERLAADIRDRLRRMGAGG